MDRLHGRSGTGMVGQVTNTLLATLPDDEWRRLSPYVGSMILSKGKLLYEEGDVPRYGYFPASGMASVLATTADGGVMQIATVCRDGFVGIPILLQRPATGRALVQVAGEAYRVPADLLLREFRRCGRLHAALLQEVDRLLTESARAALCHRYHSVLQRVCHWLLHVRDGVGLDLIDVTQEHIAEMLAVPRSGVSAAAAVLQERGLIRQRRARIQVLKARGIELLVCECYRARGRDAVDDKANSQPDPRRSTTVRRVAAFGDAAIAVARHGSSHRG